MLKRVMDIVLSLLGLLLASPVLLPVIFLVCIQDGHSPFYIAPRVGRDGQPFRMVKLRSMVKNADRSGVDSTASNDMRITPVGRFIRRYKLDELSQLWNVIKGDMSLVGPRPNVERETRMYSAEEQRLLTVRPGITDYASIVFSDEGEILRNQPDPDVAYNQLIRPWKGHLGLFYVDHRNLLLDLKLLWLTPIAMISRGRTLNRVCADLEARGAPRWLVEVASRQGLLQPAPPPGFESVITARF